MHQVAAGFLVQIPWEASNGQRNLPRDSQIQNVTGPGAVSAHGVRQRLQGSVSGVSGACSVSPSTRNSRKTPILDLIDTPSFIRSAHCEPGITRTLGVI